MKKKDIIKQILEDYILINNPIIEAKNQELNLYQLDLLKKLKKQIKTKQEVVLNIKGKERYGMSESSKMLIEKIIKTKHL